METKQRKYYIDWWNIKKSTVYGIVAVIVLICVLGAAVGGCGEIVLS